MTSLLVDAALLACPIANIDEPTKRYDIIEKYLRRLANFSSLRSSCVFIKFWRDERLAETLHAEGAYPFRHALREIFQNVDPDFEFQIEDINTLATAMLEKSLVLEEAGEILDLVISEVSIDPPFGVLRPQSFTDQLIRSIALALPVLGDGEKFGSNVYVATQDSEPEQRAVKFLIEMTENSDGTCDDSSEKKELEYRVFSDVDSAIAKINVPDLWSAGGHYEDCIALCAAVESMKPINIISKLRGLFQLGTRFLETADNHGFLHDPKKIPRLLRACTDILLNRNLRASHSLRSGYGAREPQIVRNSWAAWRHDIDDEYHLHYWRDGIKIKFSDVVTHNVFSIAD